MNNLHVKTGDTAVVLSGKEKGKRGKVEEVSVRERNADSEARQDRNQRRLR